MTTLKMVTCGGSRTFWESKSGDSVMKATTVYAEVDEIESGALAHEIGHLKTTHIQIFGEYTQDMPYWELLAWIWAVGYSPHSISLPKMKSWLRGYSADTAYPEIYKRLVALLAKIQEEA